MAIDRKDLERWWKDGVKYGMSHLLLVGDGSEVEFCVDGVDIKEYIAESGGPDRIWAIYNLKGDAKVQMGIDRPWNL